MKSRIHDRYEEGYRKGYAEGAQSAGDHLTPVVQELCDNAKKEGRLEAIEYLLYSVVQFLGDDRGWTRESIIKGIRRIYRRSEMILEDYTTYEEIKEAVKEDYGIQINGAEISRTA